jgi:hypothetical protein
MSKTLFSEEDLDDIVPSSFSSFEKRELLVVSSDVCVGVTQFIDDLERMANRYDMTVVGHHNAREYIAVPDEGLKYRHSPSERMFGSVKT